MGHGRVGASPIVGLTIAVSGTASAEASVPDQFAVLGLEIPTIDTAIVYLQASNSSGGTFRRIQKLDGTGDWSVASSVGNKMIFCDVAAPFKWFKVEVSAAQNTAARTFYLIGKS